MTIYELAVSVPREIRDRMAVAGILCSSIERYIYIYEMFNRSVNNGRSKMDAYAEVSVKCFTCEDNVRKIIQRMNKQV